MWSKGRKQSMLPKVRPRTPVVMPTNSLIGRRPNQKRVIFVNNSKLSASHQSKRICKCEAHMDPSLHLTELARQIRRGTLEILNAAQPDWLTWAPEPTSNHMLWHAGHALWLQDVLCIEPLTGYSELPDGWADSFGMNCRPVSTTSEWPSVEHLNDQLVRQLNRMTQLFEADSSGRLARIGPNIGGKWDLVRGIIHGLYDEAKHSGEMYLLWKMCHLREKS